MLASEVFLCCHVCATTATIWPQYVDVFQADVGICHALVPSAVSTIESTAESQSQA